VRAAAAVRRLRERLASGYAPAPATESGATAGPAAVGAGADPAVRVDEAVPPPGNAADRPGHPRLAEPAHGRRTARPGHDLPALPPRAGQARAGAPGLLQPG